MLLETGTFLYMWTSSIQVLKEATAYLESETKKAVDGYDYFKKEDLAGFSGVK